MSYNSNRSVAALDNERGRGVERALDRSIFRVDGYLVTNKTLKGDGVGGRRDSQKKWTYVSEDGLIRRTKRD